jgi:diguanylate cyclase (GGDEF)-like protein/PAS domain S-box-containing protein
VLSDLRQRAIADNERELRNTAFVTAEEADRVFQAVELLQLGLIDRLQNSGLPTIAEFDQRMSLFDIHVLLREKIQSVPHTDAITLVSASGKVLNSSRPWPLKRIDVTDRDYFTAFQTEPDRRWFVGEPIANRGSGAWVIPVARKIVGPEGELFGLLVGAIGVEYFQNFFSRIALGPEAALVMYRADGTLVARGPHPQGYLGRADDISRALATTVLAQPDHGLVARQNAPYNGKESLIAGRRLAHYPIVVAASKSVDAALEGWQTTARYLVGLAVILIVTIGGAGVAAVVWLRKQNSRLDAAINNMHHGLLMYDRDNRLIVVNRRYLEMYGLSPDEVKPGCHLRSVLTARAGSGTFDGDIDAYIAARMDAMRNGAESLTVDLPDGRIIAITNIRLPDGRWMSTHQDITERKRVEDEAQRARAFLHTVVENIPATVVVKNAASRRYVLVNRAAEKLIGVPRAEILGKRLQDLFPRELAERFEQDDQRVLSGERPSAHDVHALPTPGNGVRIITSRKVALRGPTGGNEALLIVLDDVTERVRAEQRVTHLASHDPLTDLPNRTAFNEHLETLLRATHKPSQGFALMCVDLDHFKEANDVFGHAFGDELLREVARRLSAAADGCFLARLGGDEFAVITPDAPQPAMAKEVARRIQAAWTGDVVIQEQPISAGLSIGVAVYPTDAMDAPTLIRNADAALYRAKEAGRGTMRFFEAEMDQRLRERRAMQHDLRSALISGELFLHYQPQARLDSTVIGFEALARWCDPVRGMVSPAVFIPLAEESGLIMQIGEWALREACREAASWPRPLQISVNLSTVQFRHGDLPGLVHSVLLETGLAPNRLELEITESALIGDFSRAVSILSRIKAMGVRIHLDDFGTGYSSLSYLHSFPFDKIKIDRTFLANAEHSPQSTAIIRAVIGLARGLGVPVLSEGVETEEQLEFLLSLSCDEMQGYLVGRPASIDSYSEVIGRLPHAQRWALFAQSRDYAKAG